MSNPKRKNENWTKAELSILQSLLPTSEVARLTGRSEAAIRGKLQRLNLAASRPKVEATFEQDAEKSRGEYWRDQYKALASKYQKALKQTTAVEQLVAMASSLAPLSYETKPKAALISKTKPGKAQSAVLLLSDTHVGQVIEPNQTLGFGKYDFPTFLARLKFYEEAVISILRDHTTTDLDELVICLGGDMIHGALNHSAEAAQHNTLFQQFYGAGHAIAQFIQNLSAFCGNVQIRCTVGNHPRWGTQHKMPTDNRYSNLDQFLYAYTQALTRELRDVHWHLDTQPVALFDVQGFRFHLSHGDSLRGGDKALGIPNHAVGRMVSSNSQLFGKRDEPAPHYYLLGHLHRGIVLPHSRGSVIVNGGFPGIDGFGLAGGFSPVDPKQVFFLVHPKYGKTATYDIELKFADANGPAPYSIPGDFGIV